MELYTHAVFIFAVQGRCFLVDIVDREGQHLIAGCESRSMHEVVYACRATHVTLEEIWQHKQLSRS